MSIKKTFGKALTTSYQDIYTVPTGKRAEWRVLFITDTAGSTINVDVQFYDSSESATLQVLSSYSLGSNNFLQIGGDYYEFINMKEGDIIKAKASASATCLVSIIEENDVIQGG
jgi:hypothetical protein